MPQLNAGKLRDAIMAVEDATEELDQNDVLVEVDGDVYVPIAAEFDSDLNAIVIKTENA